MIVELYNQEIIKKSLKFYKDKKIFKKMEALNINSR